MSLASTAHELKCLVRSWHPIIVLETVEEDRVRPLLALAAADLRLPFYEWSITEGLRRHRGHDDYKGTTEVLTFLMYLKEKPEDGIYHLKDFGTYLGQATTVRALRDLAQRFSRSKSALVLTGESIELPPELEHKAVRIVLHLPNREELRELVHETLRSLKREGSVQIELGSGEGRALLDALSGLTAAQARRMLALVAIEDGRLDGSDIDRILERKRRLLEDGGLLDYYPPERNRYEIGGFGRLKAWLERARIGFTPEAQAMNLSPPRGILIVGVQGCGKSLAAKFVAREWKLPLLKLDGGRLYDKYIGETEKNLRRAMKVAESMAPAVLWIDEIEKVFAQSQGSEHDGGVSRRIFGTFLTWLQEKKKDVFVVGAANDLFSLPPELLRKGRFDEIFFVDLPDPEERKEIFRIHLRLRNQKPEEFDLDQTAAASEGFSGAEIEQAVIGALYRSLHGQRPPSTELLLEELGSTVPLSVSRREDLERLRESARGRFVPVK
ncbi:MAG TPA: AAA family ATPase [Thermoanaerobaculia bacterium]|nr:AAA family ATPase [Thermoanaerobaculia bacterium]